MKREGEGSCVNEEAAVDEIMDILGVKNEPSHCNPTRINITLLGEAEELARIEAERKVLGLYNAVIDALEALGEDDRFCKSKEAKDAFALCDRLREARLRRFEATLIDWHALAVTKEAR